MTLREFSNQLYNYHKREDTNISSLKELCDGAKDFFMESLGKVEEGELSKIHSWRKDFGGHPDSKGFFMNEMGSTIDTINDIVKKEDANDLDAANVLYELIFAGDRKLWGKGVVKEIGAKTDFYRVRKAEKYQRYDRKEMFAIPDDISKRVGAYRFNSSGYSCLYLASNLYLAWEECRRPDLDMVNFSHFVNTRKLKVLDLTIPIEISAVGQLPMSYLTLLCCAKATDEDAHHFQYVVPQLLMKVLRHQQKVAESNKTTAIDGIRYLSSRRFDQKDFLLNERKLSTAYVFPQRKPVDCEEWDSRLVKLFKFSEPRTWFVYKIHSLAFNSNSALVSDYQKTLFYQMEQTIKKDEVKRVNE